VLVRITWAMLLVCLRMLFVVARPIWRVSNGRHWLKAVLLLLFVLTFFYRPAIAYYWFWGSVIVEVAFLLGALLFGEQDSVRAWWKRR
jgi:hypothetical protein